MWPHKNNYLEKQWTLWSVKEPSSAVRIWDIYWANTVPTAAVLAVQDPSHPILSCYTDHALDFGTPSNAAPLIRAYSFRHQWSSTKMKLKGKQNGNQRSLKIPISSSWLIWSNSASKCHCWSRRENPGTEVTLTANQPFNISLYSPLMIYCILLLW